MYVNWTGKTTTEYRIQYVPKSELFSIETLITPTF